MNKVLLGSIALSVIIVVGVGVFIGKEKGTPLSRAAIPWEFNGQEWNAQGNPPTCPDPLQVAPLVDIQRITAILYPGQYRSQNNYKAHGGFAFQNSANEDITVTAPMDGHLVKAGRYIEAGEVQYLLFFVNSCGMMYKLDHLQALAPKFQEIIDTLPEAKLDDSRTTPIEPPVATTTGEVIATSVGFHNIDGHPNVSMDFGLMDLRQKNNAANDPAWLATRAREGDLEYAPYALCMLDYFDSATTQRLKNLPAYDRNGGKNSDYCR